MSFVKNDFGKKMFGLVACLRARLRSDTSLRNAIFGLRLRQAKSKKILTAYARMHRFFGSFLPCLGSNLTPLIDARLLRRALSYVSVGLWFTCLITEGNQIKPAQLGAVKLRMFRENQKVLKSKAQIKVDHLNHNDMFTSSFSSSFSSSFWEASNLNFEEKNSLKWYPMDSSPPKFDAVHYRLDFHFPDESFSKPYFGYFSANAEITLMPNIPTQLLEMDAAQIKIHQVRLLGELEPLRFENSPGKIFIDLNRFYQPDETITLVFDYEWRELLSSQSRGMYFKSRILDSNIDTVYSHSEPEDSLYWFPGNKRPNDPATFETLIQVPQEYIAVSNGALVSVQDISAKSGKLERRYHWRMQSPMVSYLSVLTAGIFGVDRQIWNGIPVEYYGPKDDMERVRYSLRNTPRFLDIMSELSGLKYPYEKYAQTVVPQYMMGGMEHTTATTLTDATVHGPAHEPAFSSNSLVAHELAHQWFGDFLTCKSWDHLWLNEGFATYFDAMTQEKFLGGQEGQLHLMKAMEGSSQWYFSQEMRNPHPMVFPYYQSSLSEIFNAHAYAKGAWVLHMLRKMMGDEVFLKGIRLYVEQNPLQLVTTEMFREAMEISWGRDLKWFFDQWAYRPGFPEFDVRWSYDSEKKQTKIQVKQTQNLQWPGGIVGNVPLFQGPISGEIDGKFVKLILTGGSHESITEEFYFATENPPRYVVFNSEKRWLARTKMNQDLSAWVWQLTESPDFTARLEAAKWLEEFELPLLFPKELEMRIQVLTSCSLQQKVVWIRSQCVESLGNLLSLIQEKGLTIEQWPDLRLAFQQILEDSSWEVRESLASTIISAPFETAIVVAKKLFQDSVLSVASEAIRSAGQMQPTGEKEKEVLYHEITSNLDKKSHRNKIQLAGLQALSSLKDIRALSIGQKFAKSANPRELRVAAFELLVRLGLEHPEAASELARVSLEIGLWDLDFNIRFSVVGFLGRLNNKNARSALQRVELSDVDEKVRDLAKKVLLELAQ